MMTDKELEKLIKDIEEGKSINFNDQFKMLATIYKKISDLSSRISIIEDKLN